MSRCVLTSSPLQPRLSNFHACYRAAPSSNCDGAGRVSSVFVRSDFVKMTKNTLFFAVYPSVVVFFQLAADFFRNFTGQHAGFVLK